MTLDEFLAEAGIREGPKIEADAAGLLRRRRRFPSVHHAIPTASSRCLAGCELNECE
jgi:hypothetical protein